MALDQKYIFVDIFTLIYNQAEKVSKINSDFITYLLQHEKESGKLKKPDKPKNLGKSHDNLDEPNKPSQSHKLRKLATRVNPINSTNPINSNRYEKAIV